MHKDKKRAIDDVVDILPDWGHSIAQLNAVIAERMGLSVRDLDALYALGRQGPTTASDLGSHVGLTSGSATRMIDRLERAGFVGRVRDSSDRRRVVIEATAIGLDRVAAFYVQLTKATREDLSDFTAAELVTVAKFLRQSTVNTAAELTGLKGK
nr:MarR family transcriptional regulator [Rhodococcus sp. (in: high G+C Gram-positive bacteria)]